MSQKLHKTKAIVLRTLKYGETSLIVTILTELFGIQTYLLNGVRASTKKGSGKANIFQPAAILDLVVYHHELRNLQRIREFRWAHLYHHIFSDIKKNAVALFMAELLTKCLKQPEVNVELFQFAEDCFLHLDQSNEGVTANFPLFFALHLSVFFGVPPNPPKAEAFADSENFYFDLQEGTFLPEQPNHPNFIEGRQANITAELLRVRHPQELEQIKLNHDFRRNLLYAYERYYAFHIQDFGTMKTLPVLREILN